MAGGRKNISLEDAKKAMSETLPGITLDELLQKAVVDFNKKVNSMYLYKQQEKIENVQSQVVQGMIYYVTMILNPTNCRKSEENVSKMITSFFIYYKL